MKALVLAIALVSATALPVGAQTPVASISAVGVSEREVLLDQAEIIFALATERNSFDEAVAAAESTVSRLRQLPIPAAGVSVVFDYDLAQLRQSKWSRGKKLDQQFRAVVREIPDGAAQRVIVRLIDAVVEAEPGITVERYETSLSAAKRSTAERQLLGEAVLDARTNAAVMAEAAGLRLDSARTVVPGREIPRPPVGGNFTLQESVTVFPARRSFTAMGEAAGSVLLPMAVTVTFNAAPK